MTSSYTLANSVVVAPVPLEYFRIEEKFELNLESLHEYKTSFDNHKNNYDSKLRYRDSLEI